jgi:hypothetical protein
MEHEVMLWIALLLACACVVLFVAYTDERQRSRDLLKRPPNAKGFYDAELCIQGLEECGYVVLNGDEWHQHVSPDDLMFTLIRKDSGI